MKTYQYKHTKELSNFSQTNRKQQTDAEKLLWYRLRNRQIAGVKFRRQYPIDNYILDFYCVEKKLAIELDGSQHLEVLQKDQLRENVLKGYGIIVVRFWDNEVLQNSEGVLTVILEYLTHR